MDVLDTHYPEATDSLLVCSHADVIKISNDEHVLSFHIAPCFDAIVPHILVVFFFDIFFCVGLGRFADYHMRTASTFCVLPVVTRIVAYVEFYVLRELIGVGVLWLRVSSEQVLHEQQTMNEKDCREVYLNDHHMTFCR